MDLCAKCGKPRVLHDVDVLATASKIEPHLGEMKPMDHEFIDPEEMILDDEEHRYE